MILSSLALEEIHKWPPFDAERKKCSATSRLTSSTTTFFDVGRQTILSRHGKCLNEMCDYVEKWCDCVSIVDMYLCPHLIPVVLIQPILLEKPRGFSMDACVLLRQQFLSTRDHQHTVFNKQGYCVCSLLNSVTTNIKGVS